MELTGMLEICHSIPGWMESQELEWSFRRAR